jgi:hypothetical protein
MKKILILTLSVFALSAQAGSSYSSLHNWNNLSVSFKSSINAAETGYKANLAVNMAWRDTGKMIKQAKKLNAAGKKAAAVVLAHQAYQQTVNATAQSMLAADAGPNF